MPTVLCIDDQEIGLATRKMLLETKGYDVLLARSGQAGLDLLAANEVAAVLLDYSMPAMNGEEVARAIKAKWPAVVVIMLSGYPEIPESAMEAADLFVMKGSPPSRLLSELERLMGTRPAPKVLPSVERSRELQPQVEAVLQRSHGQRKGRG